MHYSIRATGHSIAMIGQEIILSCRGGFGNTRTQQVVSVVIFWKFASQNLRTSCPLQSTSRIHLRWNHKSQAHPIISSSISSERKSCATDGDIDIDPPPQRQHAIMAVVPFFFKMKIRILIIILCPRCTNDNFLRKKSYHPRGESS